MIRQLNRKSHITEHKKKQRLGKEENNAKRQDDGGAERDLHKVAGGPILWQGKKRESKGVAVRAKQQGDPMQTGAAGVSLGGVHFELGMMIDP